MTKRESSGLHQLQSPFEVGLWSALSYTRHPYILTTSLKKYPMLALGSVTSGPRTFTTALRILKDLARANTAKGRRMTGQERKRIKEPQ